MPYQGKARHPVTEIILHCADTRPEWMAGRSLAEKVTEIRSRHVQQRGRSDIGHHWVIDRDGAVAPGRAETEIRAHVEGHNAGTIGVCLLGGYGAPADDPLERNFAPTQKASAVRPIDEIKRRTAIGTVSWHDDFSAKAPPGFKAAASILAQGP